MSNRIAEIQVEPSRVEVDSTFKLKIKTANEIRHTGTNLTFNNSKANQLTIRPEGHSEQDTYIGKNKFIIPDSTTYREVTLTKNNDGTFNIKGTATGGSATFQININSTLTSGTYTLSKNNTNNNLKLYVQDRNNQSWISNMLSLESGSSVSSNITPTGNQTYFVVEVSNGATVDLENVKVQLEKGSQATSWEKYVRWKSKP